MRARSTGALVFDVVLTLVLGGLGTWLMVENILATEPDLRLDSQSWWMLPVFLAAVVPVLWWRRSPLVVALAAAGAMALHVVLFGWVVRCGAGLPLTWALAYLVGTKDGWRRSLLGLAAAEAVGVLVLVRDSAAGPGLIPIVAVIVAGLWGVGRLVHQRSQLATELERRNAELTRLRDARAALEVDSDRARLSADLDALLDVRLAQLARTAASAPAGDADATHAVLARIETESRDVLAEMRIIVGQLRGGEVALAPAPSVAHLDALLAQRVGGRGRVVVAGEPHGLPASVELSVYRLLEHLLGALADDAGAPVEVRMRFAEGAVEVTLTGRVSRAADLRAAVARARERVRLQRGSLEVRTSRGRAEVVASVPVGG